MPAKNVRIKDMMKYDIIGDIHGHADQLRQLLESLDYKKTDGGFTPPSGRKTIFVGDFIDRGPQIRETLEMVKSMCDRGVGRAVLGNHEYNALCYHTRDADQKGEWLRPHTEKNIMQHQESLDQFEGRLQEWQNYLNWFMELPLFLDLGNIRVVHASWVSPAIDKIRRWTDAGPTEHPHLSPELLQKSAHRGSEEYKAFEAVLKGVEISLPNGCEIKDKEGHLRGKARIRWWEPAEDRRYEEMIFPSRSLDCSDKFIEPENAAELFPYSDPVPVFFGHYWRNPEIHRLEVQADHICCLDYSVARGGRLVSYRWEGEKTLRNDHFVSVQCH
jgi:hypothetical protein